MRATASFRLFPIRPRTLILGCLAALGTPARASGTGSDGSAEVKTVVMMVPEDQRAEADAAAAAVKSHLVDLPVSFRVEWVDQLGSRLPDQVRKAGEVASRRNASTVFWCDLSSAEQSFVYFFFPAGERVLARSLEQSGGGGRLEALALIARSMVGAVVRGDDTEVPAEKPEEKARASEPVTDHSWLGIEVAYALEFQSSEVVTAHGLSLGIQAWLHRDWSVFAGYRIVQAATVSGEYASSEVQRHPFWLGVRGSWSLGRWALGGSVAFSLDNVTQETGTSSPGMVIGSDKDDLLVSVTPAFEVGLAVFEPLRLVLTVGAEIFLANKRIVADGPEGREVLLAPWQAQPIVLIGLRWAIF